MIHNKILITGIAGFIGTNLLGKLLELGYEVVGIDDLSLGNINNIAKYLKGSTFRFIHKDVTKQSTFDDLGKGFDCIVHLAAFKIPRYGDVLNTLRINSKGAENVLEFASQINCKCILASTSDVYGRNTKFPFQEDDDSVIGSSKVARWSYAVSKLFDEHLGFAYQDRFGFPVTILRFFNAYGPYQHLSWCGGAIPVFIDAVLNDQDIPIHGDGLQTRSFTYVDDTVEGISAAIITPEANGQIINIGSTQEITIIDLARKIKQLSNTSGDLKLRFVPYESFTGKRYEDVLRRIPDTTLCEQILNVKAKVNLDDGLIKTILWQRNVARVSSLF
jgi:UDP-glucose 4-epimerase